MMAGTRIFVIFVFSIIAIAFLVDAGGLIYEFGGPNPLDPRADWLAIATLYSHHFLFFPILGIFTLIAFYIPACVFVDMYWRVVRFGRLRLIIGSLALAGLSYQVAGWLQEGTPSVWQIKPEVLQQDKGTPEMCGPYQIPPTTVCTSCSLAPKTLPTVCRSRQPLLKSLRDLRDVSQNSIGVAPFARTCEQSPLVEPDPSQSAQRYCFVSGTLTDAPTLLRGAKGLQQRAHRALRQCGQSLHARPDPSPDPAGFRVLHADPARHRRPARRSAQGGRHLLQRLGHQAGAGRHAGRADHGRSGRSPTMRSLRLPPCFTAPGRGRTMSCWRPSSARCSAYGR